MTVSNIKATIPSDIHKVWEVITAVENYSLWRSDLSKCERLDEKHFVEYTKDGYATNFAITLTELYKRWEFDMDNSNMSGHWTGIFTSMGSNTTVEFIEEVSAKKVLMKPFVKGYLKKQQALFIEDLKKVLG